MDTRSVPIVTTTSLSVLLHAVVIVTALLVIEQATSTGHGVDIQLLGSTMVSEQQETEQSRHNHRVDQTGVRKAVHAVADKVVDNKKINSAPKQLVSALNSNVPVNDAAVQSEPLDAVQNGQREKVIAGDVASSAQLAQSANASQQHTILELLHNSVSNNKEYPYMARRQRREGVATVGFVLHPDGRIRNTHLVTSSRTMMLDRAALTAVKRIEPFAPARDYIEQAEEFKIDVVFKLL